MTDRDEWQGRTGESWATEWRRTDRSFTPLTAHLLERIGERDFTSALDIGCGAGELALAIARDNPGARIVGVDISSDLLAVARTRAARGGLANAEFALADAAKWQPPDGFSPGLLISRHGVMFFDEPRASFAHLARIAAPGAALVFSCFRKLAENPFFTEIAALLPPPAEASDPDAPGPFAFADSGRVARILEAGGWRDPAFEPFDFAMVAGKGEDPVGDALGYFTTIGPVARAARELGEKERAAFLERLRRTLEAQCREGQVALGAAAWIVTACAP